jgi:hypothetical protein
VVGQTRHRGEEAMEKPIVLNDTEVAAVAGGCSCSVFSINIFSNSFNNSHDNMLILGSSVVNSFNTDSFNTDSFNTESPSGKFLSSMNWM